MGPSLGAICHGSFLAYRRPYQATLRSSLISAGPGGRLLMRKKIRRLGPEELMGSAR